MTYPAKKDGWMFAMLIVLSMIFFGAAGVLAGFAIYFSQPLLSLPAVLMASVGLFLNWAFVSTSYEIAERTLELRFGPLRWSLPLDTITELYSTNRLIVDVGWSLVWSLDRVRIKCRDRLLPFYISPLDKPAFMAELIRARPNVTVKED